MRFVAILLLIGFISASFSEKLEDDVDEYMVNYLENMEETPFIQHVGLDKLQVDEGVNDLTRTRLLMGKRLKETMNSILERIKSAIEQGKEVQKEVLDKIKEVREQLKELKGELGEEAKELWEKVQEKSNEYITFLLDKLSKNKKDVQDKVEEAMAELNLRDVLLKLRDHIKNNVDPELLKAKVEKIFAQGSEILRHFLQLIKEKAKHKLLILIDQLLDEDDDSDEEDASRAVRGIKDYWDKIKNYFKDLKIDLQEKYMKFGEWVKENWNKGMEHSKDKMENITAIAREFVKHAKGISKEVANEAGEFFRQYKDELGMVWDEIKEKIQEIRNRKD